MSRTSLKKELSNLTAPQLVEVILDAYESRPEIKEYFEYYLNPDAVKLTDKYMRVIVKEFNRSKRRYSKARVSVVNKTLKQYRSFTPGADNEVKFIVAILETMAGAELSVDFTETQWNLVAKLVNAALLTADAAGIVDQALIPLSRLSDKDSHLCSRYFTRAIGDAVLDYNSQKTISTKNK